MAMRVTEADVLRMRDQLFAEGDDAGSKLSKFWLLLLLAAVIAATGVEADSTATVIGAMIVAPLMTPILGIVLAMVLNDRRNLVRSVVLVIAGGLAVVAIGMLLGLAKPTAVVAATNSQVAGRVSPRLIDLLGALATGAVGAIALLRSDISDTLPGVAIAISLVPPLSVVGLTLESGAPGESAGALLLFLTNVSAILASGLVVMATYGLLSATSAVRRKWVRRSAWSRPGVLVVAASVILVAVPLAATSVRVTQQASTLERVKRVVTDWAAGSSWSLADIAPGADAMVVRVTGLPPMPDPATLRSALDSAGLASTAVDLELIPEQRVRV